MRREAVRAVLEAATPPDAEPALVGLWHLTRGDWEGAHAAVQAADDSDSAWVHAHLHRMEGDHPNAAYWYRRAGREIVSNDLDAEREAIAAALIESR